MSTDKKCVWTRKETWALINSFEKREILWNCKMKDNQNKGNKEAAYAEIAQEIETKTTAEIKKKIHALRSQHCGKNLFPFQNLIHKITINITNCI